MTPAFLTPLRIEKIGPQRWILIDHLVFRTVVVNGVLVVPRGFQTDFASIPRIAQPIFPKVDAYDAAAALHDAAYGNALLNDNGDRVFLIKRLSDPLFHEACLVCGVVRWRAGLMYWVVTMFGDPAGHPLAAHRPAGLQT